MTSSTITSGGSSRNRASAAGPVARGHDLEPPGGQAERGHLPDRQIVLDEQHPRRHGRILRAIPPLLRAVPLQGGRLRHGAGRQGATGAPRTSYRVRMSSPQKESRRKSEREAARREPCTGARASPGSGTGYERAARHAARSAAAHTAAAPNVGEAQPWLAGSGTSPDTATGRHASLSVVVQTRSLAASPATATAQRTCHERGTRLLGRQPGRPGSTWQQPAGPSGGDHRPTEQDDGRTTPPRPDGRQHVAESADALRLRRHVVVDVPTGC